MSETVITHEPMNLCKE